MIFPACSRTSPQLQPNLPAGPDRLNAATPNHPNYHTTLHKSQFQPSNTAFGIRIAIWAGVIAASSFGIREGGVLSLIGTFTMGVMFAHGVELQHQALHYTGFSNKTVNRIFGFALGLPMLVCFTDYQSGHLRHHRYLGTPANREYFEYTENTKSPKRRPLPHFLSSIFMGRHYANTLHRAATVLFTGHLKDETDGVARKIRIEYLLMLLLIASTIAVSATLRTDAIAKYWLLPLLLVSGPVHSLIELPEHHQCSTTDRNIFMNTRSITSNWFMTWLTNSNNFHVEHHLAPGLPLHRAKLLHLSVKDQLFHYSPSYRHFFMALLLRKDDARAASSGALPPE